jgi:hypothetical protein
VGLRTATERRRCSCLSTTLSTSFPPMDSSSSQLRRLFRPKKQRDPTPQQAQSTTEPLSSGSQVPPQVLAQKRSVQGATLSNALAASLSPVLSPLFPVSERLNEQAHPTQTPSLSNKNDGIRGNRVKLAVDSVAQILEVATAATAAFPPAQSAVGGVSKIVNIFKASTGCCFDSLS